MKNLTWVKSSIEVNKVIRVIKCCKTDGHILQLQKENALKLDSVYIKRAKFKINDMT